MTEYIVNVPDEDAEHFIEHFGFESVKLMGYSLTDEIVRCRDCKHFCEDRRDTSTGWVNMFVCDSEQWNTSSLMPSHKVEPDGFCAWGKLKESRICKPTEDGSCPYCGEDLVRCDMAIGKNGGAIELDPPIYHNYCPNCGRKVKQ